jgi:hypothetical protein
MSACFASRCASAIALAAALAGCGGTVPPAWQLNAKASLDHAAAAYLEGNARMEAAEFAVARSELSRTGRPELLARAELMRCAAHVASLVFERCEGFEALRADASPPERAYADYLAGKLAPADAELLPEAQRHAARAGGNADAAVQEIADPFSKLVAAGVLLQAGRASPAIIGQAIDAASSQGWRRPLLAWLNLQLLRVQKVGDEPEAERLRRRIAIVQGGGR